MLTEIIPSTTFAISVNGIIIQRNIPSSSLAESLVFQLPQEQRAIAEIVSITNDGKTVLLG